MKCFYHNIREQAGKDVAKRGQSALMEKLQQDVKSLISQLEHSGIPYSMPDDVCNDSGERTNSRREAGHTKGNTKNQRKNIKRQQRRVLTAVVKHLHAILVQAGISPCVYAEQDGKPKGYAGALQPSDSSHSESDRSESDEEWRDAPAAERVHSHSHRAAGTAPARMAATGGAFTAARLAGDGDSEWDRALDGIAVLFRAEPLGFRVLERVPRDAAR